MNQLLLLTTLVGLCSGLKFLRGVKTVPELDASKYLGRWYQVYADAVVMKTFERNGVCITADYGLLENGVVSVFNAMRITKPNGELKTIKGTAKQNVKEPGKLTVNLNGGLPFGAPYWVVRLGPVVDGKYEYSVVTDRERFALFVLVRDPQRFADLYEKKVLEELKQLKFVHFFNKPIKNYQGADCLYAPKP
ncbi:apolipoprotein D-like [Tubulanus polymorphus]|uniref:apolipoprotein D-like n=1 Tax=Tubulanus polymorphus TaxID=672921 RepID=UPI003DA27FE6